MGGCPRSQSVLPQDRPDAGCPMPHSGDWPQTIKYGATPRHIGDSGFT